MRFPDFYGNDRLKNRLSAALSHDGFSHCYILSGPKGSGKKTLAKCISAAMECTGSGPEKPCGLCPNCHKIFGAGHPDVICVDSDKATVPISVIRDMQADAYIRPNEGKKKIYLIHRAQDMQPPAQNALLKILEEPPEYCVFFLLTDNPEKLLTTIRSRAVELTLFPLKDRVLTEALKKAAPQADEAALSAAVEKSGGYLGAALELLSQPDTESDSQAARFAEAFSRGDDLALLSVLAPLEKWKRQDLLALMEQLHLLFVRALSRQSGAGGLFSAPSKALSQGCTPQQLYAGDKALCRVIDMLNANGSAGHAVGYLLAEMS